VKEQQASRNSVEAREGEHIQSFLGLAGEVHQHHAHDVTRMAVPVARHNDTMAMDFFTGAANEVDRHFGPKAERLLRSKLEAVLPNADVVEREADLRPIVFQPERLENPRGV
jgi:hypothetical protein